MRILFVQETDWLQRNPHQQHHLAELMSLRGHEIRVIDYEFSWRQNGSRQLRSRREVYDDAHKVRKGAKIHLIRPGTVKLPYLEYVSLLLSHRQEIGRQIAEYDPHVIVGLGILNAYLAARAARRKGIPFLYYWIDVLHTLVPSRTFQPIARMIEGRTLAAADRVLVINEMLREQVIALGAPRTRTQVIGAGIDIDRFDPSLDGAVIRQKYGIGAHDVVLFFMGWLYHFSGLKEVALQLAREADRNIKLLIVGEGDAYDELQRIRESHGLGDRMILTGKVPYDDIPPFIAASDVCLLPANPRETIMQHIVPIKVYEYMAMKKPVITTRLPGVMKEFGHDNGVLYVDEPEDVIVKAVELTARGNVHEAGSRARAFVETRAWDRIAGEFEATLTAAIEERRNERDRERV